MDTQRLTAFRLEIEKELKENILSFWIKHALDIENGGFVGYMSNDLIIDNHHDKSSVLNSRILWTYSTAYRIYHEEKYLTIANRAFNYLIQHFWDNEHSGVYWMVDFKGNPSDTKKQIYALAFAIYGLSEYFIATQDSTSLKKAIELYEVIEKYSYDPINKGYTEALRADWTPLADMSLSSKDLNVMKSMNTHLHILEAYTHLLSVWDNDKLRNSLKELINVTLTNIVDPLTNSFKLYFDKSWNSKADIISCGHDIEGSWLLYEAAEVLGDEDICETVRVIAAKMAQQVYSKGIDLRDGGLIYEIEPKRMDCSKEWWPQAEAVVGFFNAYQLTGKEHYLDASESMWEFIKENIIDPKYGEWYWGLDEMGDIRHEKEKIGPWKCPYHNSRMCFEIINRIDELIK